MLEALPPRNLHESCPSVSSSRLVRRGVDRRARSGCPARCAATGAAPEPEGTHQACHFRKRATSAPAEGPTYGLDFARHCEFPSELCRRRRGTYTEVARLVPPDTCRAVRDARTSARVGTTRDIPIPALNKYEVVVHTYRDRGTSCYTARQSRLSHRCLKVGVGICCAASVICSW